MISHIPVDFGVPLNGRQFGLYFYPRDRFLFVGSNEHIIDTIRSLLRSKLFLSKLPIHSFKNWDPCLVDNTVCLHWGVKFEDSAPVLTDCQHIDESLTELAFFANMIYWIELSLVSLVHSKSFILGGTHNSEFGQVIDLIDDAVVTAIVDDDARLSIEFDIGIEKIRKELHKICYWAKSKDELVDTLADFVTSDDMYVQLFHKEILHWWKLN